MKVRYITSDPNWTYKLIRKNVDAESSFAVLTGQDNEACHRLVAESIRDMIGFENIDCVTKKPLGDTGEEAKEVEVGMNYLKSLLY
jgi:hypothetical protein